MSAPAEVQAKTLNRFLDAWKAQDVGSTIDLWSEDFKQRLLPYSLGAAAKSKAEAAVIYPILTSNLSNWKLEIKQIVHDAARGTAAVYATSSADTPLPDEKWATDFAVFISFTEDGTQINKLDEMVDSAFYRSFFRKFQQYLAETRGAPAH
ncbi:uncharacterized protein PG986_011561 [Apiospora aurea]|uniref:SnoaL-like domain-containing protein n=1 Tax=Apiospora aurea TaxID=335848 RepID=A0ABR1PXH2_9PEZI